MTARTLSAACLAAILSLAPPVFAQPSLEVIGTWGGAVNAVFVDPNAPDIAYIGSGRRLVILDVSNPAAGVPELGSIDLGNLVMDLKVRDGFAYIATFHRPNTFCVVDVSDLTAPTLIWSFQAGGNSFQPREVDLYRHLAYVRSRSDITAFDISDPLQPQRLSDRVLESVYYAITIVGDVMYAPVDRNPVELRVFDLSANPLVPLLISTTPTSPPLWQRAHGVAVEGGHALIPTADFALAVMDVSNPAAPVHMANVENLCSNFALEGPPVTLSGGLAYIAEGNCGLKIFDVATDPSSPALIVRFGTHGRVEGVEVVGTRAYVMDYGEGLIILDISNPASPLRLGNYHSPAGLRKMDAVGDLLYVTDVWNGLSILEVSDPRSPTLLGAHQAVGRRHDCSAGHGNWGIQVRDGLAYFAAGCGGLEVLDVTNPANPTLAGVFPFAGNEAIALKLNPTNSNIVHVGVKGAFIVNFDISDLNNIRDVGSSFIGPGGDSRPYTLEFDSRGLAHVAVDGGVVIADPSEPNTVVATKPWTSSLYDLALDGDLRYVTNSRGGDDGGLHIQDLSEPNSPTVGFLQAGAAYGVGLQDQAAYVVATHDALGGVQGLLALDASDPTTPVLIGQAPVPGARHLLVDGRYAYVTGGDPDGGGRGTGLTIVEIAPPCPSDLDGDDDVDLADLVIQLADFNCTSGDCPGDIDGDGDTDLADLAILLSDFGGGC